MAKLPVLMYHNVCESSADSKDLTISRSNLEEQFSYLKDQDYVSLHFKDLENFKSLSDFPENAVIITFDDVYVSQLEFAYPLIKEYGLKACFYVPFKYLGKKDLWNTSNESIMSVEQLKSLDPDVIELGLHSFNHGKYDEMSLEDIQADFDACRNIMEEHSLEIHNTLAYPYGKYPKSGKQNQDFFEILNKNQIAYGLRIGNRVNTFPFNNLYEIQRIDIKGEFDLKTFIKKLKKGKSWF